ncbi:MAG: hypothetical protein EXQ94_14110 [Alphaproteobacteria bacterium]|nr:hypothetical protein [Alphaproteobacteria bacterium]
MSSTFGEGDRLISLLEAAGYETTIVLVELAPEKYIERAVKRYLSTGRVISMDYLLAVGDRPNDAFQHAQDMGYGSFYVHASNDVPRGQDPAIVSSAANASRAPHRAGRPAVRLGMARGEGEEGRGPNNRGSGALYAPGLGGHEGGQNRVGRSGGPAPQETLASQLPPTLRGRELTIPLDETDRANREAQERANRERYQALLKLRAKAPMRSTAEQEGTTELGMFQATDQGRLFDEGPERAGPT